MKILRKSLKFKMAVMIVGLVLIVPGLKVKGQQHLNDQVMSRNWNIIGAISFKMVKDREMYAVYTNEIKRYANKPFELEGYMIPIQEGMKQSKFMLSTLPINQCFYCGKNGIPAMVYVELTTPTKFTYNTVKVKGILKLSVSNAMEHPPMVLVNGSVKSDN